MYPAFSFVVSSINYLKIIFFRLIVAEDLLNCNFIATIAYACPIPI